MNLRAAIVERDAAGGIVVRDDEEGMKMRQRALIDALDQALSRAKQVGNSGNVQPSRDSLAQGCDRVGLKP